MTAALVWDDEPEPDLGFLFTVTQARDELGIPTATVRTWIHRGLIYSGGIDHKGAAMYWEADLRALRLGLRIRDDEGRRVILDVDDVRP